MKRYTITITSTEVETTLTDREWRVVGKEDADDGADPNADRYGYTPQVENQKEVTRTLFQQTLGGKLNLMAVIKAFNGE